MGVLYYLAREDNKTLFEIGKFSEISDVFLHLGEGSARKGEWLPRELPPLAELQALIRNAVGNIELRIDRDAYAVELARRITIFAEGHWICILNDASSGDMLYDHYADEHDELRVVDSVYTSSWKQADA